MSLRLKDPYELMYGDRVKEEEDEEEEEEEEDEEEQQESSGIIKKKRRPANLCISCPVCGGPAPDHVHFGGQCCYSCRAFFRRSSSRPVSSFRCRSGKNDCIITSGIKSCIPCRLTKCLQIGMDPNLVRGKKSKKEKFEEADYEEVDEENDHCLPPPLTPVESQDMLGHRNLLKYRADILKYQGMCLQYQASLLEKEAIQYPAPSGNHHGFSYQTNARPFDEEYKFLSREDQIEQEEKEAGRQTGEEGEDVPLDLTMKTRHTQSEHMPRIFFSRFTNFKP